MSKSVTALLILDGFGHREPAPDNAITTDGVANFTALRNAYPHTLLQASGFAVGLPEGQMGNSEVGHLNIGAGRVIYQELTRITKSIQDGDFFENPAFLDAIANCKAHNSTLHLWGLCSDGGVHSHLSHLYALVELAKRQGLTRVYIHCFMDGRDTPPQSGAGYLAELDAELAKIGVGKIASVMGRYYAMDRDTRYDRVARAYNALVFGEGISAPDAQTAMRESYEKGEHDEFVQPTVIMENGRPVATVQPHDSVIFFNFRPDRAREITRAFIDPGFDEIARRNGCFPIYYVGMTQYDKKFGDKIITAYKPESYTNTLGAYLAFCGKTQLRIAETEKYAHVTFFFNGGVEAPNEGEERVLIPSPKVATYDLKPEMSAFEVADETVRQIESGKFDVVILNFANPDMVGHTGIMEAAVRAVHAVDICVQKVVDAVLFTGGRCMITADHGNSERMWDEGENAPFTAHTTGPVPFVLVDPTRKHAILRENGKLCDIAPTLLELMGLPQPAEMEGKSLII
ncbi:MAG: 2,3-bisphosphoglycerate-independent phosphoglycerate mutase [Clostridiales bacterium]|nr:2,3-bisphosphoglycerate-independent phosphoglycerate mutase [Clostridiales bacterium]